MKPRDIAEGFSQRGSDEEDISAAGTDICELDVELFPVVVEPASTETNVDAIHGDNSSLGEQAIEEEADDAANRVLSEEIERVVDAHPVLDFGAVVAHCTRDNTEDN